MGRNRRSVLPLKHKLLFAVLLLLTLGWFIGIFSRTALVSSNRALHELQQRSAASQWLMKAALKNSEVSAELFRLLALHEGGRALSREKALELEANLDFLDQSLISYSVENALREDQKRLYEQIQREWEPSKEIIGKILSDLQGGKAPKAELRASLGNVADSARSLGLLVQKSLAAEAEIAQERQLGARRLQRRIDSVFAGAALLSVLAALLAARFVLRIARMIGRMSSGLGQAAQALGQVAGEMDSTGSDLSSRVVEQANQLQEAISGMVEISSMVASSVMSAEKTLQYAQTVEENSNQGLSVIGELSVAMEGIADANAELGAINEIIGEVEKKTAIIHEIVFKTQLLSFNAAIEAARAGQHGKGFAVVADEVGSLADTSGKAAEQIRKLLDQSRDRATSTIKSIQGKIGAAEEISARCLDVFNRINESIRQLTPMVEAMRTASTQQELGIGENNRAFQEMNGMTRENAKAADRLSKVRHELRQTSDELRQSVHELNQLVFGFAEGSRGARLAGKLAGVEAGIKSGSSA
ncbi:MAG: methyl-accepting chemotaxis protein [Oligoflexia bacterium]|nr:methyl-accepting chemotaxis protein [Oligoflexia bacterium]